MLRYSQRPAALRGAFKFTVEHVQDDLLVEVTFRPLADGEAAPEAVTLHRVEAEASMGGSVSPDSALVPDGEDAFVSVRPESGFKLASLVLSEGGVDRDVTDQVADGVLVLSPVTADAKVRAVFESDTPVPPGPQKVKITAQAGEHGSIDPEGAFEVLSGSDVGFSFVPDKGYEVDEIVVNGRAVSFEGGLSYTLFNVEGDTSVRVTFREAAGPEPQPTVYVIDAKAGLHGSIEPAGAVEVVEGQDKTFAFVPEKGYEVDVLTVDGERVENPGSSYRFADVRTGHRINVTFREIGSEPTPPKPDDPRCYTVTAGVAGGHGRILPKGEVRVQEGGSRTFSFLPDAGYAVSALSIDGVRRAFTGTSYRLVDVRTNHTIEVSFVPQAAPAPSNPVDSANRAVKQGVSFVKTGDAAGPISFGALVVAGGGIVDRAFGSPSPFRLRPS